MSDRAEKSGAAHNIVDALLAHARRCEYSSEIDDGDEEFKSPNTMYFLNGARIYADEVFAPNGFLPVICRAAELLIRNDLGTQVKDCGFTYIPDSAGLFGERVVVLAEGTELPPNGVRLGAILNRAQALVGLGEDGGIELDDVHAFLLKKPDVEGMERSAARWPLYRRLD